MGLVELIIVLVIIGLIVAAAFGGPTSASAPLRVLPLLLLLATIAGGRVHVV